MRESEGEAVFGLTSSGLRQALRRIGERAGFHITCLILRREFATLALRAGMNPLHLQALMGHTTLEMTRRYIQLARIDLLEAHNEHGPVDRLL